MSNFLPGVYATFLSVTFAGGHSNAKKGVTAEARHAAPSSDKQATSPGEDRRHPLPTRYGIAETHVSAWKSEW